MPEGGRGPRLPPRKPSKDLKKATAASGEREQELITTQFLRGGLTGLPSRASGDTRHRASKPIQAETSTPQPLAARGQTNYEPHSIQTSLSASSSPESVSSETISPSAELDAQWVTRTGSIPTPRVAISQGRPALQGRPVPQQETTSQREAGLSWGSRRRRVTNHGPTRRHLANTTLKQTQAVQASGRTVTHAVEGAAQSFARQSSENLTGGSGRGATLTSMGQGRLSSVATNTAQQIPQTAAAEDGAARARIVEARDMERTETQVSTARAPAPAKVWRILEHLNVKNFRQTSNYI